MIKKVIFIDMDGVLVDFAKEFEKIKSESKIPQNLINIPDKIPNIYKNPPVFKDAKYAVDKLISSNIYDLFIATTAPWNNPMSFTHKRLWIEKNFGDIFKKKMFITNRKDLLIGDFLIDDRLANGAKNFQGELLRFGYDYERKIWNKYKDWHSILEKLL